MREVSIEQLQRMALKNSARLEIVGPTPSNEVSIEQLQRMALKNGARLEVGGTVFNADREKVRLRPAGPAATEPQATAGDPAVASNGDVTELVKLIEAQEANFTARLDAMRDSVVEVMSQQPAAAAAVPTPVPVSWQFNVEYDPSGKVAGMKAIPSETTAVPEKTPAQWNFSVSYDRMGAITSVVAAKA